MQFNYGEIEKDVLRKVARYNQLKGKIAQAYDLAINRDGKLLVGVMEHEYGAFIQPYLDESRLVCRQLQMSECVLDFCKGCPDCR